MVVSNRIGAKKIVYQKKVTFISGSLRLAWSQSTETTGSLTGIDNVEKSDFLPTPAEAITGQTKPDVL